MITLVDYGVGNLGSIRNMLKKAGVESTVTSSKEEILKAKKIILPGVGSFDGGMSSIISLGIQEALRFKALDEKIPFLGICLGMQLMTLKSEEGKLDGLGWFDAELVRFKLPEGSNLKIPHMGWSELIQKGDCVLLKNLPPEPRFYFVHGYHLNCKNEKEILASAKYGAEFPAVIGRENLFGVQFHPEKSHIYGFSLLKNFSEL